MAKAAPFAMHARVSYHGATFEKSGARMVAGAIGVVLKVIPADEGTGTPIDEDPENVDHGRDGRSIVQFANGIRRSVDQDAVDAGHYKLATA